MHHAAIMKPDGVYDEANPGDAIVSHHKIREHSELSHGSSVEAQVLRPTIYLTLSHTSGTGHGCGVGGDGTLCCPPGIIGDLVRVPVVDKVTKDDHPCCAETIGPI